MTSINSETPVGSPTPGAAETTRPPTERADISLLVPVKDERDSLKQLASEVIAAMDGRPADKSNGNRWELIFIDDGSSDGSWEEIVRLSEQDARIRGLRLRRNFGKSPALAAGFATSSGGIIVTLDGDLQDDPAEIPAMIDRLDEPADVVAGHKAQRRDPLGKRLPSKVFNFFTGVVTGLKLRDHNCGLKVARREVFANIPLYGEMHRYFAAISHAQGFRVVEQPVHHRPRQHGSSKFGLERYARGGLDLLTVMSVTRYTHRPAHLFGGVGLTIGVIGMAILVYLSALWLFTDQAIGSRPLLLMGVLFVLIAMQLTSLGIVAEMMTNREVVKEDPFRHITERTAVRPIVESVATADRDDSTDQTGRWPRSSPQAAL
jgi:glycosyltransferase involved in cell wall biosynthesis